MKTSHKNPWTSQEEALARKCLSEKRPTKDYQAIVGRSYNACRQHIQWIDDPAHRAARSSASRKAARAAAPAQSHGAPRPRSGGAVEATPIQITQPIADPLFKAIEQPAAEAGIRFSQLRDLKRYGVNQCRFIEEDADVVTDRNALACGADTQVGKSYCDHHDRKCYQVARQPVRMSADERERRSSRGKAVGFANVRAGRVVGHRLPAALFPVVEYPDSLQSAEAGA